MMQFRKFRADHLFDGYQMLDGDSVLIISENGSIKDILPEEKAGDNIEYHSGILSPGFINCHCHLELSHLKGAIPKKTGLTDFLSGVITRRDIGEEEIQKKIAEEDSKMFEAGIVAVGDICNNISTISQKIKSKIYYHNFIEVFGFLPSTAEQRFQQAVNVYNIFLKKEAISANSCSIVPHAPYSVSNELWEKIINFRDNHLMTIHNQESDDENKLFLEKKGAFIDFYKKLNIDISFFQPVQKSSFRTCLEKFSSSQPLIAVHNTYTSREDIHFAKESGNEIYWCFCPNANLYISGVLPDIDMFMTEKCDIVLGTDSLASNDQLSILAEMQTIHRHFPSVAMEDIFKWATTNGAKALQMESLLGSFETGKKPGVLLIEPGLSGVRRLM